MDPVVVVGAGIAGVACARELAAAGLPVRVLDRGHRVGGRLASRTIEERPVDLGASYLTVDDPDAGTGFAAVVEQWREAGLAHPWTDTFTVLEPGRPAAAKSGPVRWGTAHGTRSLVEHLAEGLDVTRHDVRRVDRSGDVLTVDDQPAGAVVLAVPDPQAVRLLGPGLETVGRRLDRDFDAVIALAARWPERTWDTVAPDGRFEGAFVNGEDGPGTVLDWVADDGRRRGDGAPVLVAHSSTAFAAGHLAEPEGAVAPMLQALTTALGAGQPASHHVHRWTWAKPAGERTDRFLLEDRLGVCGDGWGPSPKVETAWRSGHDLGCALVERLA